MLVDRWSAGEDVISAVERALLGNLLLDTGLINAAMQLRPHHFVSNRRGLVFAVICDLISKKTPVTVLTVAHALKTKGVPAPGGYPGWITPLSELLDDCLPEISVMAQYADMVIHDWSIRKGKA